MRECRGLTKPHAAAIVTVLVVIFVGAAAATTAAGTHPSITNITMTENPESVVITIEANGPMEPKVTEYTTRPHTIALAIPGQLASGTMHKWVIKDGGIFVVRSAQYTVQPAIARIVASVEPGSHARTIEPANEGRTIIFTVYKAGYKPSPATGEESDITPGDTEGARPTDKPGDERIAGWVGFFPDRKGITVEPIDPNAPVIPIEGIEPIPPAGAEQKQPAGQAPDTKIAPNGRTDDAVKPGLDTNKPRAPRKKIQPVLIRAEGGGDPRLVIPDMSELRERTAASYTPNVEPAGGPKKVEPIRIVPSGEQGGPGIIPIGPDGKPIVPQTPSHGTPTTAWLGDMLQAIIDAAGGGQGERTAGWVGEMTSTDTQPPTTTEGTPTKWWETSQADADNETLDDVLREGETPGITNPPDNQLIIDLDEDETHSDATGDVTAQAGFEPRVFGSGTRVSVEFVETDIADVLAGLSVQTGMNIIAGPGVTGKITLRLLNAEPTQVVRMAAAIAGYSCELVDGTYVIGTPEGIEAVKLGGSSTLKVTKVLAAYYERPEEVAKMLVDHFKGLSATVSTISTGGTEEGAGAKAMIISGTPSQVADAESVLGEMAAIPAAVRDRESIHVYEARYADPVDLMRILSETVPEVRAIPGPVSGFKAGVAGSAQKASFTTGGTGTGMIPMGGSGGGGATGATSGGSATRAETVGAASNRLLLMGTPDVIEQALNVLATADVPEKQVLIHLRIADVSVTDSKKLGTLWDWATETWTEMTFQSKGETLPDVSVVGNGMESRIMHRTPMQITMTLDALYQTGNAKLLADPRVSVLSNREATFFVGDKILYPVIAGVSSGTVLYSIETEEVGIGMDVIPQVSPDGTIALSIHPFVNSITQWVSTPQGDFPQTRKREAQTTVRLRSGETVALGGLISENDVETLRKVPIIGDLPILGKLFQHRYATKGHSEVVVLITCEIVEDLPVEGSD